MALRSLPNSDRGAGISRLCTRTTYSKLDLWQQRILVQHADHDGKERGLPNIMM